MKKLSIKWRLTIFSAISIFIIFIICNLIQLIFLHIYNVDQEEDLLKERSEVITSLISERVKADNRNDQLMIPEDFFENLIEDHEMIRIIDYRGHEIYYIAEDFPSFRDRELENGFSRLQEKDDDYLVLKQPIEINDFHGIIEIGKNVEMFDDFMEQVVWVLLFGTVLSLVLSVIGGQLLARKFLAPLTVMTKTMMKIEDEHFQERIPVMNTKDEFSQFCNIFNSMMDRIEVSMEQQKRFVEDASHDLRTPLAIILGHLSLIQRWGKNDKRVLEKSIQTSIKETNRVIELTNRLLQLTHIDKLEEEEIDNSIRCNVTSILDEISNDYELIHQHINISINNSLGEKPFVAIQEEQLKQVLIILFDNAIKYSGDDKKIIVTLETQQQKCKIEIIDNGYGISNEDLPYIFDRFYRVDKARSRELGGTGLGLSIAKDIIQKYNGEISAESKLGKGTTITIILPFSK
ncbi:signal transduction histidine kinase [Lysinibacillus composti]|uniref:Signal transduction histidine-protein kinase ArlS n=1 Tax=Lysinibacillus composti TaxID=720633 RepID=A0A3N9UID0_9BACI|nr:HAMP domain-containing histidine kinase [Lysinibacillus composti]MBM7607736.1 signal transduction histidine kinase [Lysinibacillus composti]RQW75771.1 sensor histidine kinase [Lysinibacillus composti]